MKKMVVSRENADIVRGLTGRSITVKGQETEKVSFREVRLPQIFMFLAAFLQILLSAIGILNLTNLLTNKEQVLKNLIAENNPLNEPAIHEVMSLTPPFIKASLILLILALIVSFAILVQIFRYPRRKTISLTPSFLYIAIHLGGVYTDILRKKEDVLGFSIIGVLLLLIVTGMILTAVRNHRNSKAMKEDAVTDVRESGETVA